MKVEAKVSQVFVGETEGSLVTTPHNYIEVDFEGVIGDKHQGISKLSDVRDRGLLHDRLFPKKIPVRNWRQWSAVSIEDLQMISSNLEVFDIDPSLLGANLSVSGIERFSMLPRGTTLSFPEGAILIVEDENEPCIHPGHAIARHYVDVDPSLFVKAARGLRGVVGVVQRPGIIRHDDLVTIDIYEPKLYFIDN